MELWYFDDFIFQTTCGTASDENVAFVVCVVEDIC